MNADFKHRLLKSLEEASMFKLNKRIVKVLEKAYIEVDVAYQNGSAPDQDVVDMMRAMKKVIKKNK